ncbi:MAG: YqgE/AlgH family protein [bacterium]
MPKETKYSPGFLIAVPQLLDPNFYHAVVLLIEHTNEGAMGLTINHPLERSIKSLYDQMGRPWFGDDKAFLMRGGPVQPEQAWILHGPGCPTGATYRVTDGIYLNTSLDALDALSKGRLPFRFMVGYAGWGPGQLDREIQEGAWILSETDSALVFETPAESVWDLSLRNMGIDPAMLVPTTGIH